LCRVSLDAYSALGNPSGKKATLHRLCYDLDAARYCRNLQSLGVQVDVDDAYRRQHETESEESAEWAERDAERLQEKQQQADRREAIQAAIQGVADTATASMQQYQADMAQARVNAATIKMAQQNKNAGGYPTTSSGGASSTSASSTNSSRPQAKKSAASSSDASDSSSDDSSTPASDSTTSNQSYSGYLPAYSGYNPYSGKGASPPDEKGHWEEAEVNVGEATIYLMHSLISAGLVKENGEPNQWGAYVSFSNPDKVHPFFYGFAGVINERFEPGTSKLVRWPAPYLANNRPNPAFVARIAVRYWVRD
jgi:hypothetical protein